jgi:hypothetical protein
MGGRAHDRTRRRGPSPGVVEAPGLTTPGCASVRECPPRRWAVGQNSVVDVQPIDTRTDPRWETHPVRDYRVTFWKKGAAYEFDVLGVADVHEAIEWAEQEASARGSTYTLFALVERGEADGGLVWLAGVDPTVSSRPNFEREHPAAVKRMQEG